MEKEYRQLLINKLKEYFNEKDINDKIIKAYEVGIIDGVNKNL